MKYLIEIDLNAGCMEGGKDKKAVASVLYKLLDRIQCQGVLAGELTDTRRNVVGMAVVQT